MEARGPRPAVPVIAPPRRCGRLRRRREHRLMLRVPSAGCDVPSACCVGEPWLPPFVWCSRNNRAAPEERLSGSQRHYAVSACHRSYGEQGGARTGRSGVSGRSSWSSLLLSVSGSGLGFLGPRRPRTTWPRRAAAADGHRLRWRANCQGRTQAPPRVFLLLVRAARRCSAASSPVTWSSRPASCMRRCRAERNFLGSTPNPLRGSNSPRARRDRSSVPTGRDGGAARGDAGSRAESSAVIAPGASGATATRTYNGKTSAFSSKSKETSERASKGIRYT